MNGTDNYGNEGGSDNGGIDGSERDIDVGGGGGKVDNNGFYNGGDVGVIMAKMADFIMVRMVVLVMETMRLNVAMTGTMVSIWEY